MIYYIFDLLGRFDGESEIETPRSTTIKPEQLTKDYNWNDVAWIFAPNIKESPVGIFTAPFVAPVGPASLTHYQFLNLCQSEGGMTDDMLVASKQDPTLDAMWIKFDVAKEIVKDDKNVIIGIEALHSLGYLPSGVDAVFDNWPKE